MRIQKYLSLQGVASRREAEQLIKDGLVSLNGKIVTIMGVQIDPEKDTITVHTKGLAKKMTVIVNKPRGIVSSRIKSEGKTIYELLPQFENLDIIGRLDKESEGLLMLSDDGVIAKAVTGEAHTIEKEYVVSVRENVIPGKIKTLEGGIVLEDGPTLPCTITNMTRHSFNISLREGRKHQIRRMCDQMNLTVTDLRRIRIGSIVIGTLVSGGYRRLNDEEVAVIKGEK